MVKTDGLPFVHPGVRSGDRPNVRRGRHGGFSMGELVMGVFPPTRTSGVPWPRSRRLWWLLWSRCPGLGWVRLRQLESTFGSLEAAWSASPAAIAELPGWPCKLRGVVESFRAHWGKDPLAQLLAVPRQGVGVLLPGDHRWPRGMGSLQRPPLASTGRVGGACGRPSSAAWPWPLWAPAALRSMAWRWRETSGRPWPDPAGRW